MFPQVRGCFSASGSPTVVRMFEADARRDDEGRRAPRAPACVGVGPGRAGRRVRGLVGLRAVGGADVARPRRGAALPGTRAVAGGGAGRRDVAATRGPVVRGGAGAAHPHGHGGGDSGGPAGRRAGVDAGGGGRGRRRAGAARPPGRPGACRRDRVAGGRAGAAVGGLQATVVSMAERAVGAGLRALDRAAGGRAGPAGAGGLARGGPARAVVGALAPGAGDVPEGVPRPGRRRGAPGGAGLHRAGARRDAVPRAGERRRPGGTGAPRVRGAGGGTRRRRAARVAEPGAGSRAARVAHRARGDVRRLARAPAQARERR